MDRPIVEAETILLARRDKQLLIIAVVTLVVAFYNVHRDFFSQTLDHVEMLGSPLLVVVAVCYKVTEVHHEINLLFYDLLDEFSVGFRVGPTVTIDHKPHAVACLRNRPEPVHAAVDPPGRYIVLVHLAWL